VQDELDGRRPVVVPDEHRRVIGAEHERSLVLSFLAHAEEVADGRAAVRAVHPLVVGTELELRCRRGLLDGVEGGEQRRGVDTVAQRGIGLCDGHCFLFLFVVVDLEVMPRPAPVGCAPRERLPALRSPR
jgi:hypothetical protein